MASKTHHETAEAGYASDTESAVLRISGLRENRDGTFTLDGVKTVNVDYMSVDTILKDAGVPVQIREAQIETFAEEVRKAMMVDLLVQRMEQIR